MKPLRVFLLTLSVLFLASIVSTQEDQTVYVTKTGSKYHSAGCSYLKKSSIPMKLSEAVRSYSPCSRCKPPTLKSSKEGAVQKSEPAKRETPKESVQQVGTTKKGQPIYVGPRGGRYHYSASGKKVYERKRK